VVLPWQSGSTQVKQSRPRAAPAPAAFKQVEIDLDRSIAVSLPELNADLKPIRYRTPDGREGWVVKIPGGRPIATPAYWDGMIFIGGGYGSHEFYALNAQTGEVVWQIKTKDDGPTAAVVEDGCVAFNTESCTVDVCDARTGKLLWEEWLGDPLMSQPAIYKGRLYIAYPAGQRRGANAQQASSPNGAPRSHRLLCADLRTGKHLWEQPITADVISAPIISSGNVYFTCFDGTSFCLDAITGKVVWRKENSGTSAPLVARDQVILTMKVQESGRNYEGVKRIDARAGDEKDKDLLAKSEAAYLGENKGGGVALGATETVQLDASVGFSSAPSSANLSAANKQVGVSSVVGGWAYQGSRAAHSNNQMMNAQGRYLNCMRMSDGEFSWRAEVKGAGINSDSQVFSPPALGVENMYLCSGQGHLISVSQKDGAVGLLYSLKQPMMFQPALALGNVYVGTANGLIICLKTGGKDADGWYAWGGNAQHNKND
jgi:outer membrane protein assembly factor BamB